MSFIYPTFLWALAALSIPIIVHLFSFRRYKTIYFPNVLFLQEVKKESDSRTRIKHWLILASRILALSFIIFAFAQPIINNDQAVVKKGKKAVSIYIDNSFSMSAVQNDISLLETAKSKAREIINAYAPDDDFQILTNTLEGIQQRFVNRDQANLIIDDVKTSAQWRSLSEIAALQNQYLTQADVQNRVAYIISDFQKSFSDFEKVKKDSLIICQYIKLQSSYTNNISIDSCWLEKPLQLKGEQVKLFVKISNYGNESITDGQLTIEQDGQTKAIATYNIEANSNSIDTLIFSNNDAGWKAYTVRIQDYPVSYDDVYYISFESVDKIPVLIINDTKPNAYLTALFSQAQRFELTQTQVSNIQYDALNKYRLIVLHAPSSISGGMLEALNSIVLSGKNVLLVPAASVDKMVYESFLKDLLKIQISNWVNSDWQTDQFNLQHPLFKDLFENTPRNMSLPYGKGYYPISVLSNSAAQNLFATVSDKPLCMSIAVGKGQFYFSAIPFDKAYNNFTMNALFAPILFKMCLPQSFTENLSYQIGGSDIIHIPQIAGSKEQLLKLKGDTEEVLPQQRVLGQETQLMTTQLNNTGIYSVTDGINNSTIRKVALNYNRRESNIACRTEDELNQFSESNGSQWINASQQSNLTQRITEHSQGIPLWKYCITFALAFLVIEILLLKFFR